MSLSGSNTEGSEALGSDIRLVVSIHRANADAFWAREPGPVGATRREGLVSIRSGRF